ncbi:MAG: hypothetical protein VW835_16240, partial [Rickettsiales bacterium]
MRSSRADAGSSLWSCSTSSPRKALARIEADTPRRRPMTSAGRLQRQRGAIGVMTAFLLVWLVALVTLAPELEGADAVIRCLRQRGIGVALGHSAATAEQASAGFDQGITMLTHTFNAMPGLHHRAPGPLGEACRRGGIALGLIADGVHVDPTMAVLLQRLAPEQTVLVSDALAPYGLADGEHRWDKRMLLVRNGTCRLRDGTLA